MWLNITAAKVICALCIGIGTWLVYQSNPADVVMRTPGERVEQVYVAEQPEPKPEPPLGGSRGEYVRRFDRPNAMDRQQTLNLETGTAFVRSAPSPDPESAALPPLLLPQPQTVAITAASAEMPSVANPPEPTVALVDDAPPFEVDVAAADPPAEAILHRVAKGERLVRISERYYGSRDARHVNALLDANPNVKARQGRLLAGESLRVPALGAMGGPAPAAALAAAAAVEEAKLATASPRWYTIQSKDSLSGIAQRFLSDPKRWPEIAKLNRKLDPNKIVPGMRIKLPPAIVAAAR